LTTVEKEARTTEVALANEFEAAISDARERIAAVFAPACPTTAFLDALRAEVERALGDPESVPYPELADADMYWGATVKPQSRAMRESIAAIITWLEQRMITTMEVAGADLKSLVDVAAADPGPDPIALRSLIAEEVEGRCLDLHHQVAEVLTVLPDFGRIEEARMAAAESIREQAAADVSGLKVVYLDEAGGDDAHQQFAAQQWSETFADRVAHRASMLAAQPPWRHQELALVGYERACVEVERLVGESVTRLQAPLGEVRQVLLQRYDDAVAAQA
jgi:hypothetical protein